MLPRGRKKRDLTRTEAIQEAQEILSPYWHGSKPLWAPMHLEDGTKIFPLDEEAAKQDWAFLIFDPLSLAGEAALNHLCEWNRRFRENGVSFLGVVHTEVERWRESFPLKSLQERNENCPLLCLDFQNGYASGFGVKTHPCLAMMRNQQMLSKAEFGRSPIGAEEKLQEFLRMKDPGLPLLPPFSPNPPYPVSRSRFDLNDRAAKNTQFFPEKPFDKPGTNQVQVIGNWEKHPDGISTLDPSAMIRIRAQASGFSLIASAGTDFGDSESLKTSISLDIDGLAPSAVYFGSDFKLGYHNEIRSLILEPRIYHLLQHLRPGESEFNLSFPAATEQKGITLYAIDLY